VGSVVGLIPLIRELVEREQEIALRHVLEQSVGLANGSELPAGAVPLAPDGAWSPQARAV